MKIISTTDISREGNDCYIRETVTLIEELGLYAVMRAKKIMASYSDFRDIYFCSDITTDIDLAKRYYREAGGQMSDKKPFEKEEKNYCANFVDRL
jgi:hypothetical protein